MLCEEKQRLLERCQTGVARYALTVKDLAPNRGKTSITGYAHALSQSVEASDAVETARLALEQHTKQHGC